MTTLDDTLRRAHAAVEALAAIGAGQSSEHLHALDGCRRDLARIVELCEPVLGCEEDPVIGVKSIISSLKEAQRELAALRIQAADSESRYRRVEARIRTEGFAVIDAEGCIRAIDTMTTEPGRKP